MFSVKWFRIKPIEDRITLFVKDLNAFVSAVIQVYRDKSEVFCLTCTRGVFLFLLLIFLKDIVNLAEPCIEFCRCGAFLCQLLVGLDKFLSASINLHRICA